MLKRDEVRGGWGPLHDEKLNFYASPNIIKDEMG
jgi:hypothetical protein